MDLKLSTPEGEELEVTPVEMPDDVAAAKDAFHRAQANDPLESDKLTPPKRAPKAPAAEPAKRGRPAKDDKARTTTKPTPTPQTDAQRKEGVQGLVQIASGVCLLLDQRTAQDNVSFKADAYVLAANAEQIANACVETAKANEGFARAIDKITSAGPYAAMIGVMMSVGVQIAGNHGVGAARAMGAADPRAVVDAFESQEQ